jgi:hypothetical protein
MLPAIPYTKFLPVFNITTPFNLVHHGSPTDAPARGGASIVSTPHSKAILKAFFTNKFLLLNYLVSSLER